MNSRGRAAEKQVAHMGLVVQRRRKRAVDEQWSSRRAVEDQWSNRGPAEVRILMEKEWILGMGFPLKEKE